MVMGSNNAVSAAVALILDRLFLDQQLSRGTIPAGTLTGLLPVEQATEEASNLTAKFVVPNRAVGVLIGVGGATVRSITDASGARLQLPTSQDGATESVGEILRERIVLVEGTAAECLNAIEFSLARLVQEESHDFGSRGCLK